MSKSRGNVVNPDEFVEQYGSDTFRMYLMFMGDYTQGGDWSDEGIKGIKRFLNSAWNLIDEYRDQPENPLDEEWERKLDRILHYTIKSVTEDVERFSFNTAISRLMEFRNTVKEYLNDVNSPDGDYLRQAFDIFIRLLSPFAPHLGEELWEKMGNESSVFESDWPEYSEELIKKEEITIVIQVDGKLRSDIQVPPNSEKEFVEQKALGDSKISKRLEDRDITKTIYVEDKLINFVTK